MKLMEQNLNKLMKITLNSDNIIHEARVLESVISILRKSGVEEIADSIEKLVPHLLELAKTETMSEILINSLLKRKREKDESRS